MFFITYYIITSIDFNYCLLLYTGYSSEV